MNQNHMIKQHMKKAIIKKVGNWKYKEHGLAYLRWFDVRKKMLLRSCVKEENGVRKKGKGRGRIKSVKEKGIGSECS